jgi:hypothetical protein
MRRRGTARGAVAALAAAGLALGGTGIAHGGPSRPGTTYSAASSPDTLSRLSHPAHKYYGFYISQSPSSLAPVRRVTHIAGKHPNMSLFYESWDAGAASGAVNFSRSGAERACHDGMLPMLTWQSWNSLNGAGAHQPAFAPRLIVAGKFDRYIRATAQEIAHLGCPIALRFDHEDNSSWYPWGIGTPGMHNSAHEYVRMYRHVWRIFHQVHARNVIWVWSPNVQPRSSKLPALRQSYPGKKYVNWVAIDGYFLHAHESFHQLFGPTMKMLARFVPHKPWIIGETAVGSTSTKAHQISELYKNVADNHRFIGINYFETNKPGSRSNWLFEQTKASKRAFRRAVASRKFAAGHPGHVPG